jgi:hypothetical protein
MARRALSVRPWTAERARSMERGRFSIGVHTSGFAGPASPGSGLNSAVYRPPPSAPGRAWPLIVHRYTFTFYSVPDALNGPSYSLQSKPPAVLPAVCNLHRPLFAI